VISGGSISSWTFGAFADPVGRIASYSATLVTVTGSGSLSGTGLGPYSITGTADGDAYTVELDALDGDGGVLATAVHTVTIEGEGLTDPTSPPSTGDYVIGGYHDLDGTDERIDFGSIIGLEFQFADTFTVSMWVYEENTPFGAVFSNCDGAVTVDGTGWRLGQYGSGSPGRFLNFLFMDGVTYQQSRLSGELNNGAWSHVVYVHAGTYGDWYINGVLHSKSTSNSGTVGTITYSTETVSVGAQSNGLLYKNTQIAEVAVWSTDQSANVGKIYNFRERHNLMDLATPPDLFYAPLTSYGDDPDPATTDGVFEAVAGNDGTGVNMETADAVIPTVTEVSSTLTKALNVSTLAVTSTKVENVITGTTGGTGSSFP
jgi:hypothetical protein